ncbi:MAG: ATP-binding protein [Coriobacteriales bacterium]|jgi:predicted AAA+ superfamily ATPase|nr:ATP-binding protein [Coriobacteriales bacterium]
MYIKRHIEPVIKKTADAFSAVLVTGPRQVGKTTTLSQMNPDVPFVSLDDISEATSATTDPKGFLDINPWPVTIDEVQYAPDLFRYLKIEIDAAKAAGVYKPMYYLTGSQRYLMMQNLTESLAGRAGIVELLGLSQREAVGCANIGPFKPTPAYLNRREKQPKHLLADAVWNAIFQGDLPELQARPEIDPTLVYASYLDTYLSRDVSALGQVGDLSKFRMLLKATAASAGSQLNKADLSRELGIDHKTTSKWLSALEAAGIIYLLRPYQNSTRASLVKTPKLYFSNSGLLTHLLGIRSAEEAEGSKAAGALLENYAIGEIVKSYLNDNGRIPELRYYREHKGKEIDLLIEEDGRIYPIEIKKTKTPTPSDLSNFKMLDSNKGVERGTGAVLCLCEKAFAFGEGDLAIPVGMI